MNNLLYLLLLLFLVSGSLFASTNRSVDHLSQYKCKKEILKVSKFWKAQGAWQGYISKNANISLKRKTDKFAHWINLERSKGSETISLVNPVIIQKITFDEKCKKQLVTTKHNQFSNPKGMDDKRLLSYLVKNKVGIIAMWSPKMGHSFTAIKRLQKISKDRKIPVTFVLDPFISKKTAEKDLKKNNLEFKDIYQLSSLELMYRNAMMHYPSFYLYKNGRIITNVIPGLMAESDYNKTLDKHFGKSKSIWKKK
ncbi:MAG: hypothetical protein ACI9QD_001021 [Thermoproteota archaeon]|jgi:hypothetical protein